jgi:hypothetical protein
VVVCPRSRSIASASGCSQGVFSHAGAGRDPDRVAPRPWRGVATNKRRLCVTWPLLGGLSGIASQRAVYGAFRVPLRSVRPIPQRELSVWSSGPVRGSNLLAARHIAPHRMLPAQCTLGPPLLIEIKQSPNSTALFGEDEPYTSMAELNPLSAGHIFGRHHLHRDQSLTRQPFHRARRGDL